MYLSDEEKREMLEDAKSKTRKDNFRQGRNKIKDNISFTEYLKFLNDIQRLIAPFKISKHKTITKFNKL